MPLRKKRNGRVHYHSAGAFAQTRLDQYIRNGPPTGGGGGFPPFEIPPIGYGGFPTEPATIVSNLLLHDVNHGLVYTENLHAESPEWTLWEGMLSEDQNIAANLLRICPNEATYVACTTSGSDTFLARANAVGEDFDVIEDHDSIQGKFAGSSDNLRVAGIGFDLDNPELIAYLISQAGENIKSFIGGSLDYEEAENFTLGMNNGSDITFGANRWMVSGAGFVKILLPDMSAVIGTESFGPFTCSRHIRIANTADAFHWDTDSEDALSLSLAYSQDHCAEIMNPIIGLEEMDSGRIYNDKVVCSFSGLKLMARNNSFFAIKSSNGGFTWLVMDNLEDILPEANWFYDVYKDSEDIWVACSATVQYSEDYGVTWIDKTAGLADLLGETPEINAVKFF